MSCPQFIVDSFAVRTAAHLAHLSSTSYAHHKALNKFYDDLLDLVDSYAEVYMGMNTVIKTWPAPASVPTAPVALLEYYLDLIVEETGEDHESEALANILAELEALTAQTLYKLRTLK